MGTKSAGSAKAQRMAEEARIELLIRLFKMDGKPYVMSYEWHKEYYKKDKPFLAIMLKRNLIEMIQRDTKKIFYKYIGS